MDSTHILVTGDYWHDDFRAVLHDVTASITLQPLDTLLSQSQQAPTITYALVLIANSRPDQFLDSDLQQVADRFAPTPTIALVGSWCEGELRSGSPAPGIPRVYWHQWKSRFQQFEQCKRDNRICDWALPATATEADRILHDTQQIPSLVAPQGRLAISALTEQSFDMVADAAKCLGYQCQWIEYLEWEGVEVTSPDLVCIDSDSWSDGTIQRVRQAKTQFEDAPIVVLMNYPRKDELDAAKIEGVQQVVSKPFRLTDLQAALSTHVASA